MDLSDKHSTVKCCYEAFTLSVDPGMINTDLSQTMNHEVAGSSAPRFHSLTATASLENNREQLYKANHETGDKESIEA